MLVALSFLFTSKAAHLSLFMHWRAQRAADPPDVQYTEVKLSDVSAILFNV